MISSNTSKQPISRFYTHSCVCTVSLLVSRLKHLIRFSAVRICTLSPVWFTLPGGARLRNVTLASLELLEAQQVPIRGIHVFAIAPKPTPYFGFSLWAPGNESASELVFFCKSNARHRGTSGNCVKTKKTAETLPVSLRGLSTSDTAHIAVVTVSRIRS